MKWIGIFLFTICSVGYCKQPAECYFDKVCLQFLNRSEQELIYRQDNNLMDNKYQYLLGKYDAYAELLIVHQSIMECLK